MITYDYLRIKKADVLKQWQEEPFSKFTPSSLELDNALILPLKKLANDRLLFGRGGSGLQ